MRMESAPKPNMRTIRHASMDYATQDSIGGYESSKSRRFNLEEIFENKEQIEVSRFYEKLPKPYAIAVQEWLDNKIYFRDTESETEQ